VVIRALFALVLIAGTARAAPAPEPPRTPAPAPAPAPAPDTPAPAPDAPAPAPDAPAPAADAPAAGAPAADPTFGVTPPPPEMVRENSQLLTDARMAREAARSGHCEIVLELSPKLRAIDPTFHQLFAADPLIAACLNPGTYTIPSPNPGYVLREVLAEPPASFARVSGELLLGVVVGAGGALIGALLGNGLCIGGETDEFGSRNCDNSLIGGAYVGAIATIPLGVRSVGSSGNQTGSLGMTYLGSLVGGVGGLLMLANGHDKITALGLIFAPPVGAVIGFNMTRRYRPRRIPVVGALVQWSDGAGASLGVPVPTHIRSEDRTVTSIPLLGGTF
jgi:hypothetical protein